jgi:hypothetical protein
LIWLKFLKKRSTALFQIIKKSLLELKNAWKMLGFFSFFEIAAKKMQLFLVRLVVVRVRKVRGALLNRGATWRLGDGRQGGHAEVFCHRRRGCAG